MQVDFTKLSPERLLEMSRAGDDVLEAFRVLGKGGANAVSQVLANQGTFFEMDHYPKDDVYDDDSGSQYYYHAHRAETGEHGHFHTFIRAKSMPENMQPYPYSGDADRPLGDNAICHLIAISMDQDGLPTSLFTTNRWVTDETFYSADDTISLLDNFSVDHVFPCLATNNWITAMVRLFRPQIEQLLEARDRRLNILQQADPMADVFEDRDFEILSETKIDIDEQIGQIIRALSQHDSPGALANTHAATNEKTSYSPFLM